MPIVTLDCKFKQCKKTACSGGTSCWCLQLNGLDDQARSTFTSAMKPFKWIELPQLFNIDASTSSELGQFIGPFLSLYFCSCEAYKKDLASGRFNKTTEVLINSSQIPMEFITIVLNVLEQLLALQVVTCSTTMSNPIYQSQSGGGGSGSGGEGSKFTQQIWTLRTIGLN